MTQNLFNKSAGSKKKLSVFIQSFFTFLILLNSFSFQSSWGAPSTPPCFRYLERLSRQNPILRGFAVGISEKEMRDIANNLSSDSYPIMPIPGKTFEQVLINASHRHSFWEKIAVVIRDIAGGHLLTDGNHRMAFEVTKRLIERNGVARSPSNTDAEIYNIISKVARKAPGYRTAEEISQKLRGY